jgi:hypothetical protein
LNIAGKKIPAVLVGVVFSGFGVFDAVVVGGGVGVMEKVGLGVAVAVCVGVLVIVGVDVAGATTSCLIEATPALEKADWLIITPFCALMT